MPRALLRFLASAAIVSLTMSTLGGCRRSGPESATDAAAPADYDTAALQRMLQSASPPVIIDVREPDEFAEGHLRGARNIPVGLVAQRASEIPKDGEVVLVCRGGKRSARARDTLLQLGYRNVHNYVDGMKGWNGPVDK